MRVLVAFDKFKDSLSANEACAIAEQALRRCQPEWTVDSCPLADGGEGFATILSGAAHGELRSVTVTGPRGAPIAAQYGLVRSNDVTGPARAQLSLTAGSPGRIAIVEMAAASGLALLPPAERDVWQTTTLGTGELIRSAAEAGAAAIVLGVGGSATNDLGLGAMRALGLRFLAGEREIAMPTPANWPAIDRIGGVMTTLPPLFIACDVTNPLLGPHGAASVYGPQKGLEPAEVSRMDERSARIARLLCSAFGKSDAVMHVPGAGAAGGIAFGLMAAANATLLPGFEFVSDWLDLASRIAGADIVITGEGRFDDSSLSGKGPGAVAMRALHLGKRAEVFAGAITATTPRAGLSLHGITPPGVPLARALREARENLAAAVMKKFR